MTTKTAPTSHPHAPGPWAVDDDLNVYSDVSSAMVCKVFEADDFPCLEEDTEDDVQAECEANARLISAAPDMLEALKQIVHDWDGEPEDMFAARAALAKAEG